jgi:hypothetical protein
LELIEVYCIEHGKRLRWSLLDVAKSLKENVIESKKVKSSLKNVLEFKKVLESLKENALDSMKKSLTFKEPEEEHVRVPWRF